MKKLLVFYPYFTPAYKAGGPIQSIQNLVHVIEGSFTIDIVCSAFDLGEGHVLDGIVPDKWNSVSGHINVLYLKADSPKRVAKIIDECSPDIIYVNGIFLPFYSWLPLLVAKIKHIPVVLTPRGMLQRGAMAGKSFKKRASILFLRISGLLKNITWQATDEQEKEDIQSYFGRKAEIKIIGNVPKPPLSVNSKMEKRKGELKLVFLSLIARKKNLDLVLRILKNLKQPISLDIYGPVKDPAYWNECLALISEQSHAVQYRGPVNPQEVQQTIKKYHAFILLTKGENFGHAIYEALSAGTPAIISQYTPWGDLYSRNAGLTADINSPDSCRAAIETFISYNQEEFDELSGGAYETAKVYYSSCNFKNLYIELFSDAMNKRDTRLSKNVRASSMASEF